MSSLAQINSLDYSNFNMGLFYMNSDLEFGANKENEIHPVLEKYFGPLEKTQANHPFDFYNEKYYIEVKSRRIPVTKYDTQMVGLNKVRAGEDLQTRGFTTVFVFNCLDGIFCWTQNHNYDVRIGGRCDRGRSEFKQYAYVHRKDLLPIDNLGL